MTHPKKNGREKHPMKSHEKRFLASCSPQNQVHFSSDGYLVLDVHTVMADIGIAHVVAEDYDDVFGDRSSVAPRALGLAASIRADRMTATTTL